MRQAERAGRRVLLILGVLALAACTLCDETTALAERHNGAAVAAEVGGTILITLHDPTPADLLTPGGWPVPSVSSDCVTFLGAGPSADGESSRTVALIYRFEASRMGRATISIPVERGPFTVQIVVQ
jgi:hypothetical protein